MFLKKLPCLILLVVAFGSSCKKSSLTTVPNDNGCISRITRDYTDPNKTELAASLKLLQNNHIATNNIVVTRAILNDTITTNGPVHVLQHVICQQYANGLPVLFAQVGYHFNGGVYNESETSGYIYSNVKLSTVAATTLPQLRYLYVQAALKDSYSVSQHITDSCLVAEFGYYDISSDSHGQLIKAWRITPKNSDYPLAIVQDDNSKLLFYFNGLLTFNKTKH